MSDQEFPRPGTPTYKVISLEYTGENGRGWKQKLEDALNRYAKEGYRPILYGDAGHQSTVILEKIE